MFPPAQRFYFVQQLQRCQHALSPDVNHPVQKEERKEKRFRSAICPLQPAALRLKSGQLGFKFDTKKQF